MANKDEEPTSWLGMPFDRTGGRIRKNESEQRVLGVPRSWFWTGQAPDLRWVRDPVRWLRWRLEVRRRGPYAPNYEDFTARKERKET